MRHKIAFWLYVAALVAIIIINHTLTDSGAAPIAN